MRAEFENIAAAAVIATARRSPRRRGPWLFNEPAIQLAATARIRNRRNHARRMRAIGDWALVIGAGLLVLALAVFAVAITAARYHAGI